MSARCCTHGHCMMPTCPSRRCRLPRRCARSRRSPTQKSVTCPKGAASHVRVRSTQSAQPAPPGAWATRAAPPSAPGDGPRVAQASPHRPTLLAISSGVHRSRARRPLTDQRCWQDHRMSRTGRRAHARQARDPCRSAPLPPGGGPRWQPPPAVSLLRGLAWCTPSCGQRPGRPSTPIKLPRSSNGKPG